MTCTRLPRVHHQPDCLTAALVHEEEASTGFDAGTKIDEAEAREVKKKMAPLASTASKSWVPVWARQGNSAPLRKLLGRKFNLSSEVPQDRISVGRQGAQRIPRPEIAACKTKPVEGVLGDVGWLLTIQGLGRHELCEGPTLVQAIRSRSAGSHAHVDKTVN